MVLDIYEPRRLVTQLEELAELVEKVDLVTIERAFDYSQMQLTCLFDSTAKSRQLRYAQAARRQPADPVERRSAEPIIRG